MDRRPISHANTNGHSDPSFDEQRTLSLEDYLSLLYRGRWWIAAIFVAVMTVVCFITFTASPIYEASTTLMIDKKQGLGESLFDATGLSSKSTLINNQVEILQSRALAKNVAKLLINSSVRDSLQILRNSEGGKRPENEVTNSLRGVISVSPVRDTDIIRIEVTAATPFAAAFITNSVAKAYKTLDKDLSQGEISQVVQFLETQLERKEKDLQHSEEKYKKFLEEEKIVSLGEEAIQVVEQSAEFESLYKGAKIDFQAISRRLEYLKNQLGRSKETLETEISQISTPLVLQLREEMAQIERNIAVYLSQGVSKEDPQVQFERQKLKGIKKRLSEEIKQLVVTGLPADNPLSHAQELVVKILDVEVEMSALQARMNALKQVVAEFSNKLESLPDKHVQLARLERNRKVDENLYMMMREKYEESLITQAGQIGKVRIIDTALPPDSPVSPKVKLNLILGVLLGLGLGIGYILLRDYLDRSVRKIEEVEAMGFNVLGVIPTIDPARITANSNGREPENKSEMATRYRLVTYLEPKSPVSESYRTLRTTLQFSNREKPLGSVLVTSSGPSEGKTTTVANLGIAMSQQGSRTIIIDTDLRRPVIHRLFDLDKKKGLTNVLIGKLSLEDAIQHTSIPNLDVLPSGILPPNPAEMLGSNRMKAVIKKLKEHYDICFYDSPPLIAVTDAAILATELDATLLVVKSGHTHRDAVRRSRELLKNVDARISGVLLNDVSRANTYGSYYYYYYNHYYSSSNGGTGKSGKTPGKSGKFGKYLKS